MGFFWRRKAVDPQWWHHSGLGIGTKTAGLQNDKLNLQIKN